MGSNGGGTTTLTYTGRTQQATITAQSASAGRLADAIFASIQLTTDLAVNLTSGAPQIGAYSNTYQGKGGGSVTIVANINSDGTGTNTITYNSYDVGDGVVWNGSSTLTYLTNLTAVHSEEELKFTDLRATMPGGDTQSLQGTIERLDTTQQVVGATSTDTLTSNLLFADSSTGRQIQTQNLALATQAPPAAGEETISGRVYDSTQGYVDLTSDTPLALTGPNTGVLTGGPIEAHGAGSNLWLAPVTPVLQALELDASGSGAPTQSVLLANSQSYEAQLAKPSSQAPAAAAGPALLLTANQPTTLEGRFSGAGTNSWSSYAWRIAFAPPGSQATLTATTSPTPVLTPDVPGDYLVALTPSDGSQTSVDAVALELPFPDQQPVPWLSPQVNAYLGPDTSVALGSSFTPNGNFSTWTPLLTSQSFIYTVTTPAGAEIGPVMGDQTVLPPTFTASSAGFYSVALAIGTPTEDGGFASQIVAAGTPLSYFRSVGLRSIAGVEWISAVDINGDGWPDIVTAGTTAQSNVEVPEVAVFLSNGPGRFAPPQFLAAGDGGTVAVADMNGDGRPDIVVEAADTVQVILQTAGGSWSAPTSLTLPGGVCVAPTRPGRPLVVADFNHDGLPDIAFIDPCNDSLVDIFFQQPGATFTSIQLNVAPNFVTGLVAGDVTGDGIADLILLEPSMNGAALAQFTVYPGAPGTALGTPATYPLPNSVDNNSVAAAIGDFNRDGKNDLVVISPAGCYLFLQGAGSFGTPTLLAAGSSTQFVTLVDVDGDGLPDLVTVSPQTYAVTVAYQQANGTLGPAAPLFGATPLAVGPVQFVNITGSGAPDVLFAGNNPADQNASIIIVPHRR